MSTVEGTKDPEGTYAPDIEHASMSILKLTPYCPREQLSCTDLESKREIMMIFNQEIQNIIPV